MCMSFVRFSMVFIGLSIVLDLYELQLVNTTYLPVSNTSEIQDTKLSTHISIPKEDKMAFSYIKINAYSNQEGNEIASTGRIAGKSFIYVTLQQKRASLY